MVSSTAVWFSLLLVPYSAITSLSHTYIHSSTRERERDRELRSRRIYIYYIRCLTTARLLCPLQSNTYIHTSFGSYLVLLLLLLLRVRLRNATSVRLWLRNCWHASIHNDASAIYTRRSLFDWLLAANMFFAIVSSSLLLSDFNL